MRLPRFACFLFSHKVMRFLGPVFLLMCGGAAAILLASRGGYAAVLSLVGVLGAAAAYAAVRRPPAVATSAVLRAIEVFLTVNAAMAHGWWKFLTGKNDVTWQHDRSAA
jgi:hypothetical protein